MFKASMPVIEVREIGIGCIFCKNPYRIDQLYGCFMVSEENIPDNQQFKFSGQHESGKTNMDVLFVQFENCTLSKIPQGLTKIFPNLEILEIWNSNLKNICKNDLVEYKNLKKFRCEYNEVEFLPDDLFENFANLELISFKNNKLTVIEPNILDGLDKLKYVDFRVNPNYGKFYSVYPGNEPNAKLDEIKINLIEKFFKNSKFVIDLKNSEQNLKNESQQLKKSKLKLETALEQEKIKNFNLTLQLQKGIVGDLKAFTQDKTTKDFKIIIEGQEFPVHKFLVAARSPTLAEILMRKPEAKNLKLLEISVKIFEIILKFLYTDELPGDDGINFMHLFAAAGKLRIQELKEFAAAKIIQTITEENVIEILKFSNKYNHDEMRFRAFAALKRKYPNANLKAEFAVDMDKIDRFVEAIKRKEEIENKIKEMCNN